MSARLRVPARSLWLGAAFVAAALAVQFAVLGLPAVLLSAMLVVAYLLWIATDWRVTPPLRAAFPLSVLLLSAHAAEEYVGGLPAELPALFGRAPLTGATFVAFNGAWVAVFLASAAALRPGRAFPALVVLFFAVAAGVGNGVVHLLLVLWRGGYFPGAWTAPLCFAVGLWLLWLLYAPAPSRRTA